MKAKFLYCFLVFLFSINWAFAQKEYSRVYEDFGLWNNLEFDYKLSKKWKINADFALRLNNNASLLRSSYFQLGVARDLKNKWDFVSKFRYSYRPDKQSYRISGEFKKYVRFKPFNINYRTKVDADFDIQESENQQSLRWRNRIGVEYKRKKHKLSAFTNFEWFHEKDKTLILPNDLRWKIGASYPISKALDVELVWMIQEERNRVEPLREYVLAWAISYSLN